MYEALSMSSVERAARARSIQEVVREKDIVRWLDDQVADIEAKREAM